MKNKTGKHIFFVFLLFVLSLGSNNKAALSQEISKYPRLQGDKDIYKFEAVLPDGWRYKINTSNVHGPVFTEEPPKFILTIEDPYITCEKEIRFNQYTTGSPQITLFFHDKWDMPQWAAFDKKVTKLHNSAEAVSAPALFIETDKYTVFTYGGQGCPGKATQEIEDYLKGYFKKYNDPGVNAVVRAIQEDEIKTAVFLYQFEQNPSGLPQNIDVRFLSVGDPVLEKDPTDYFLKRFQGEPFSVKKVSQCKLNAGVEDRETGLKGKICQVTSIKWVNDSEVEVTGGIYFDLMAAGGYIYHVVRENDQWIVKEAKLAWFS